MHIGEILGSNLKRLMREAGYTQKELAGAAGVGQASVSAWLRGEAWPRRHELEKVCAVLRADPVELFRAPGGACCDAAEALGMVRRFLAAPDAFDAACELMNHHLSNPIPRGNNNNKKKKKG